VYDLGKVRVDYIVLMCPACVYDLGAPLLAQHWEISTLKVLLDRLGGNLYYEL